MWLVWLVSVLSVQKKMDAKILCEQSNFVKWISIQQCHGENKINYIQDLFEEKQFGNLSASLTITVGMDDEY